MTFELKNKKPIEMQSPEGAVSEAAPAPAPALKGIGPLVLVVERARRAKPSGGQGHDWAAVAQKVMAEHQALGARAMRHDLLAALRRIPDQAVRDGLVSQLGGSEAEGLRTALAGEGGKGAKSPQGAGETAPPKALHAPDKDEGHGATKVASKGRHEAHAPQAQAHAQGHGQAGGHVHAEDDIDEAELQSAQLEDTSDPDHIGEDKRRGIKEETERSQAPKVTGQKPDEYLGALGLAKASLTGMSREDLDLLMKSAENWNTDPDGRSHGVISTQDHARGKGGSAKQERLKKLSEFTGRGSFDGEEPMALHKVTQLLTELTASPALPPRELGERKIYFHAKDGEQPPYTAAHKGIIIIKSQGKIVTFMHGTFGSYEGME